MSWTMVTQRREIGDFDDKKKRNLGQIFRERNSESVHASAGKKENSKMHSVEKVTYGAWLENVVVSRKRQRKQ